MKQKKNNLDSSKQLIKEAEASLLEAHKSQAALLAAETKGEGAEVSFILVHAQDHLMTTMLLKDMMQHLLNIYKKNRI